MSLFKSRLLQVDFGDEATVKPFSLNDMRQNVLGGISGKVQQALGGGTFGAALGAMAANRVSTAASSVINRTIGSNGLADINKGLGVFNAVNSGNFNEAGLQILGSGLLDGILPGGQSFASQARYLYSPNELFGDITPLKAKDITLEFLATKFAKNNLFLIRVKSNLYGDVSKSFNLFCTEASYSAQSLSGEKHKVGSATVDSVSSSEPTELRLTTLDTKDGFIKQWFNDHCVKATNPDGTVGVPADYAITISVIHSAVVDDTAPFGYADEGLFRPATIETSLSRRENSLEEITMTFTQLDSYRGI
jgi:hypothetical protein